MPLSIKVYEDKIEGLSTTANDSFEISRVAGSIDVIENLTNNSVATISELPSAVDNTGRIVYIENICQYYKSNGLVWNNCFTPPPVPPGPLGGIWGWGSSSCGPGTFGVLGDNDVGYGGKCSPVSISGGFTDWCQVSNATCNGAGVRTNGTIWTWGMNTVCNAGALGDNTTYNRSSPVSVVGGFTDWCQVDVGDRHMMGLRTDGSLWGWGNNNFGQLGNDSVPGNSAYSSPVSVVGGFTDWCQVSAGRRSTAAVRTNGTVWTWGCNQCGVLGINDGSIYAASSPVSVVGGFTDWCQVKANKHGGFGGIFPFMAGIRTNGSLWTWGSNDIGQLGVNGGKYNASSPVSVVGGFTDWEYVATGYATTMAIRANGTLWAWGSNGNGTPYPGVLGDNTTYNRSSPVAVAGGFTDWTHVTVGVFNAGGVRANGTAYTWGLTYAPEQVFLGHGGAEVMTSSPVIVTGGFTDWTMLESSGIYHWHGIRNV